MHVCSSNQRMCSECACLHTPVHLATTNWLVYRNSSTAEVYMLRCMLFQPPKVVRNTCLHSVPSMLIVMNRLHEPSVRPQTDLFQNAARRHHAAESFAKVSWGGIMSSYLHITSRHHIIISLCHIDISSYHTIISSFHMIISSYL